MFLRTIERRFFAIEAEPHPNLLAGRKMARSRWIGDLFLGSRPGELSSRKVVLSSDFVKLGTHNPFVIDEDN